MGDNMEFLMMRGGVRKPINCAPLSICRIMCHTFFFLFCNNDGSIFWG